MYEREGRSQDCNLISAQVGSDNVDQESMGVKGGKVRFRNVELKRL